MIYILCYRMGLNNNIELFYIHTLILIYSICFIYTIYIEYSTLHTYTFYIDTYYNIYTPYIHPLYTHIQPLLSIHSPPTYTPRHALRSLVRCSPSLIV